MQVLVKFRHGLGDAVQLTSVLAELARSRPTWKIDVASLVGKHTAFKGQVRQSLRMRLDSIPESQYSHIFDLDWQECPNAYGDRPSTKAEWCLEKVFNLRSIQTSNKYHINVGCEANTRATRYLEQISGPPDGEGRYRAALIHYQGNTSAPRKNLSDNTTRSACDELIRLGMVPIILDWDRRSSLPDGRRIHCPGVDHPLWANTGTGDAEMLCALIRNAKLVIGVDSGPQKVAGATDTPTLAVWTGNHPIHYFCVASNVTHLVPSDHQTLIRGSRDPALNYFSRHYKHRTYTDVTSGLCDAIEEALSAHDNNLVKRNSFWVRRDNIQQDLVIVGDIFENDSYRVGQLPLPQEIVVDVGAHIGTFAARWHKRNSNSRIFCVEACPENIAALRANAGGFAEVIHAACTYENDIVLLNAVSADCRSTGGSRVVAPAVARTNTDPQYRTDIRDLPKITLESLMSQFGLDRIDLLKLDCEGSEFSILEKATCLDRVRMIVGEYHGRQEFVDLVQRKFSDWNVKIGDAPDFGNFWMSHHER